MYLGSERKKLRLHEYNYSEAGWYFVTICVKNQECCFGGVQKDIMCLNEYGTIVQKCWYDIVHHYAGITLDEFIIMPNHVHGIIVIEDGVTTVGARHAWPLRMRTQMPSTILRPYQKLPIVVGSFKSAVSKIIHLLSDGDCFQWQRSFLTK